MTADDTREEHRVIHLSTDDASGYVEQLVKTLKRLTEVD